MQHSLLSLIVRVRPYVCRICIDFISLLYSRAFCYEIQYTWTARSTETETETGLDRYVMLGARWLTEY